MPAQNQPQFLSGLLTREIRPIQNWSEFLDAWNSAKTVDEMMGLLHAGFNIPMRYGREGDDTRRIVFYCTIADGWRDGFQYLRTGTNGNIKYLFGCDQYGNLIYKEVYQYREMLATKAFNMLCIHFFKEASKRLTGEDDVCRSWVSTFCSDPLFSAIIYFFRVEKKWGDSHNVVIRNVDHARESSSPHEKMAQDFLLNLAWHMWEWQERKSYFCSEAERCAREEYDAAVRVRLDAAKPWMVEILAKLDGGLELLRKWILQLDQACVDKLKEIALRNTITDTNLVKKERQVLTLDEARFLGSPVAWFLEERELKLRERERLREIREAERSVEQANSKLAELTELSQ